MMRYKHLEHSFVEHIPEKLDPGVLYISMKYATATHSCCCGCGEEVVTPFSPTDWKIIFDGETVSLMPSIGNWNLPCRSHYIIRRGMVVGAGAWTDKQIEAERRRDRAAKAEFYGYAPVDLPSPVTPVAPGPPPAVLSLWRRWWNWLIGKK